MTEIAFKVNLYSHQSKFHQTLKSYEKEVCVVKNTNKNQIRQKSLPRTRLFTKHLCKTLILIFQQMCILSINQNYYCRSCETPISTLNTSNKKKTEIKLINIKLNR